MSRGNVVSLCDESGVMVEPWAEAGYDCYCYDWANSIRKGKEGKQVGNIRFIWADILGLTASDLPRNPTIIFAFPACTNLAVSDARDFQQKGIRGLIRGLELVEACRILCDWFGCPWALENPISTISTYWRKPDYTFHPWNYGDPIKKKTCLWTGGGFKFPPYQISEEPKELKSILDFSPSEDRACLRSKTPAGFARAVFEANRL